MSGNNTKNFDRLVKFLKKTFLFEYYQKFYADFTYEIWQEIHQLKARLKALEPKVETLQTQNAYLEKVVLPHILYHKKEDLLAKPIPKAAKKKDGPLNIVQLSTFDNYGGAAIVAWRLHNSYNDKAGHNATMLVGKRFSEDAKVTDISTIANQEEDTFFKKLCLREGWLYWHYLSSFEIPYLKPFQEADVLHMHNLHGGYFNYFALPGLTRQKPALWTLHDMQPLTGHCAHAFDCDKWQTGCDNCPMMDVYPAILVDSSQHLWRNKKELFAKSAVDIVVPSKWLLEKVKKSYLAEKDAHLIYNGIDTEVFRALPKLEMRDKYDIPPEAVVFVISATGSGLKGPWKGGDYLLEVLRKVKLDQEIVFVNIGGKDDFEPEIEGVHWINTGHLFDEREIVEWYSTADILVYPSLADNCPLVVLEALACSLPVVAFNTGGIPELVRHMQTGYIAEYKNADDLLKGIELFLSNKELREIAGKHARKEVENNFSAEKMVKSYLDLYYRVIEKRSRADAQGPPGE